MIRSENQVAGLLRNTGLVAVVGLVLGRWSGSEVLETPEDGFWNRWRLWKMITDGMVTGFVGRVRQRVGFAVVTDVRVRTLRDLAGFLSDRLQRTRLLGPGPIAAFEAVSVGAVVVHGVI